MSDQTPPNEPTRTKRTADYRDIYANQTLLSFTGTDVQVILATSTYVDGKPINDQHATLYLAPAQAKFLGLALVRTVEAMERQQHTTIVVPESMIEVLKFWENQG
jgi:hypothetical protein